MILTLRACAILALLDLLDSAVAVAWFLLAGKGG
jgi:hypothetical protein